MVPPHQLGSLYTARLFGQVGSGTQLLCPSSWLVGSQTEGFYEFYSRWSKIYSVVGQRCPGKVTSLHSEIQVLLPTKLTSCFGLVSELRRPVGLVENGICGDMECSDSHRLPTRGQQKGTCVMYKHDRRTRGVASRRCIGHYCTISWTKDQIRGNNSIGHGAGICGCLEMRQCLNHTSTLFGTCT